MTQQDTPMRNDQPVQDVVQVRIPADPAYLSVLRTATAGLAARLDFTIDEIEDLRIAVDEACALLLPQADVSTDLTCVFELGEADMVVTVAMPTTGGMLPSRDTFSWRVLAALAGEVDASMNADGQLTVTLRKRRGVTE